MTDDLVKRLRTACSPVSPLGILCSEAADELERAFQYAEMVTKTAYAETDRGQIPWRDLFWDMADAKEMSRSFEERGAEKAASIMSSCESEAVVELRDRLADAEAALKEAVELLKPFYTNWADENGWTDNACQNDRIVDWFGPSDFRAARRFIEAHTGGEDADK
jgi:hypothetical protein